MMRIIGNIFASHLMMMSSTARRMIAPAASLHRYRNCARLTPPRGSTFDALDDIDAFKILWPAIFCCRALF